MNCVAENQSLVHLSYWFPSTFAAFMFLFLGKRNRPLSRTDRWKLPSSDFLSPRKEPYLVKSILEGSLSIAV